MGFGGALLALSAVQAVGQIGQGYAQKAEANANAELFRGKANLIDQQSQIESGQYDRKKSQVLSTSMANLGKAGIMPQGSPMAVMIDTQTQIQIDQAISKFNYAQEKQYANAQADQLKRQGRQAVYTGYSNAFSTALQGTSNYMMYKGGTGKKGK